MDPSPNQSPGAGRRLHGAYWSTRDDGSVQLTAQQCVACGASYLPVTATCVRCGGKAFRPMALSRTGRLYTYTIVRGSGGVWPAVYAIGYVDFPEEVRVCGHLRDADPDKLRIGMPVAVEEAVLYTDGKGIDVRCFRFHSIEEAS